MCPLCTCCIPESVSNRSTSFNINIYCLCCLENVLQSQRSKNNDSNAPLDTIWLHHVAFSKGFQLMASTIQWWLSFINVPKGRIWPVLSSDHNIGVFCQVTPNTARPLATQFLVSEKTVSQNPIAWGQKEKSVWFFTHIFATFQEKKIRVKSAYLESIWTQF